MHIAWDNKADSATIVTDSELATLPASNVQHAHLARKWHTAAGVKSAYLILDMGASVDCGIVAVLGTNLTATATVQIRASDSDATVTSSLEYDSGSVSAGVKDGYGAIYKAFTAATARYWRIDLADSAVASNLQVGRVFVGPAWQPSVNMELGWHNIVLDPSMRERSYGGQGWADRKPKMRAVSFSLAFMEEAEMYANAFALAMDRGLTEDLLVVPDSTGSYLSEQAVYGALESAEPLVNYELNVFRQKFTVRESL